MDQKKKRGRPPVNDEAMTAKERKQRYHEKMAQAGVKTFNINVSAETAETINKYCELTGVPRVTHITTIAEVALHEWAKSARRRWPEIVENINALKQAKGQRND